MNPELSEPLKNPKGMRIAELGLRKWKAKQRILRVRQKAIRKLNSFNRLPILRILTESCTISDLFLFDLSKEKSLVIFEYF